MRPVHSRSPYRQVRLAPPISFFTMPESGNQYVSLDDGAPRGWFSTTMSHPRERTLLFVVGAVSLVALGLLFSTIYYAKHTCPDTPVTPTTPTSTPAPSTTVPSTSTTTSTTSTTPATTSTTPATSSTTSQPSSSTTSTSEPTLTSTSEEPSTKKHKTTTESTVSSTTEENTTFTTREPKTKSSTEPSSTELPSSTKHPKVKKGSKSLADGSEVSGSKKKSKHEQDFW